jgi:hypothetical protein
MMITGIGFLGAALRRRRSRLELSSTHSLAKAS